MSEYSFRLATLADKPLIIGFLDTNWGSKHPLVHNEDFFNYYYVDGNLVQFGLCFEGDALIALCGYIKANNCKSPDIWASIWCAAKGKNGAGLELMEAMPRICGCKTMACNNIRPKTMAFYTFLGYTAKRLPHYYRLAKKNNYTVCSILDNTILPVENGSELLLVSNLDNEYEASNNRTPYKDNWYIKRRYFEYPQLKYNVYKLADADKTDALLVTRTVNVDGINVLKIVDYTGMPQAFNSFGFGINKLMLSEQAEYVEMYCYGIPKKTMAQAGFSERCENSQNIIPNYLMPLLQENTEYYFFTSNDTDFTMFKADGDQDRPNIAY